MASTEEWKRRLIDLFVDDATPAVEIIRATAGELAGTNQYDMPSVPTWHRGPMVIVGDAAHATSPSSGQGASMAIEDAVVLAKCLRDLPDVSRAFAAYEQLRRERVERVVAQGARSSSGKAAGPIAGCCVTSCCPCSSSVPPAAARHPRLDVRLPRRLGREGGSLRQLIGAESHCDAHPGFSWKEKL